MFFCLDHSEHFRHLPFHSASIKQSEKQKKNREFNHKKSRKKVNCANCSLRIVFDQKMIQDTQTDGQTQQFI